MRQTVVRLIAAACVALIAAACADDGLTSHDALEVQAAGGDQTLFPADGPPPGLHLRVVDRDTPQYPAAWVALYGDPEAEDPLAGDIVHVIYYVGSETGIGWQGGTAGERWVVLPTDDDDQEVDDLVVGARGLDENDLRDLAERVELLDTDFDPNEANGELRRAHLAEGDLTSGRVLLAEGPLDLSEVWSTYGGVLRGGPALQWDSEERRSSLRLSSIKSDPATSLLIRSIVDDPGGTPLRGTNGVLGTPTSVPRRDWSEVHVAVWEEAGMLNVAQSYGLAQEILRDFVEQLRPTADDDWPRLVDEAELAPPISAYGTVLASGSFDGGRWWVALLPYEPQPQIEQWIEAVDGRLFEQGSAGGCPLGYSVGHTASPAGSLISGFAPPEATAVVLELAERLPLEVTATPRPDGVTFWNVWIDGQVDLTALTVRDANGGVMRRIEADELGPMGLQGGSSICR